MTITKNDIKKSTNFKTVLKQTILSTSSQPSTWISFAITFSIMLLLVVILPLLLPKDVGSNLLYSMLPAVSLMIILWTTVATTNGLELHEMTFVLTRPVNRKNYIIGKFFASLSITCIAYFGSIILMMINLLYFKIRYDINVLTVCNIKLITLLLPTFLAWVYGICTSIFFKSFFIKDQLIALCSTAVWILTYQLYIIIASTTGQAPDHNVEFLLIPSVVFSTLAVTFFTIGYFVFQKIFVRV